MAPEELLALGPGRLVRWRSGVGLGTARSAELLVHVSHDGREALCLTRSSLRPRHRWHDRLEPVGRPTTSSTPRAP